MIRLSKAQAHVLARLELGDQLLVSYLGERRFALMLADDADVSFVIVTHLFTMDYLRIKEANYGGFIFKKGKVKGEQNIEAIEKAVKAMPRAIQISIKRYLQRTDKRAISTVS